MLPVLLEASRRGAPTYQQLLATFSAASAVFRPYQTLAQNPLGAGHIWSIGTYIDSAGPLAGLPGDPASERTRSAAKRAACADVEAISPKASRRLGSEGGAE